MKDKTKLIILIIIGLFGIIILISGLFEKRDDNIVSNQTGTHFKEETTEVNINTTTTTKKAENTLKTANKKKTKNNVKSNTYKITHYGYDCKGCSGTTASGYNVKNTIYYNDSTYGTLRIVAIKNLPLYSVIKIKNYDGQEIKAIVLDKPKNYGIIDLLVENEKTASKLGIRKNIEIEILREGK